LYLYTEAKIIIGIINNVDYRYAIVIKIKIIIVTWSYRLLFIKTSENVDEIYAVCKY